MASQNGLHLRERRVTRSLVLALFLPLVQLCCCFFFLFFMLFYFGGVSVVLMGSVRVVLEGLYVALGID